MFNIAELGVTLRILEPPNSMEPMAFSGDYVFSPRDMHPIGLVIEIQRRIGFEQGRSATPNYPEFKVTAALATELRLSRSDAEGTIYLRPGQPVRAEFIAGMATPTVEGIIRVAASLALLRTNSLILHSSAIADRQGAHVFSGVSGAGKSTIAALLEQQFPVKRLADELLIVTQSPAGWKVVVAPFAGKVSLPQGESAPLKSINFLIQWPTDERTPLRASQAVREIARHVLTYSKSPETNGQVLELLHELVASTPCYELRFAKSASVGEVLRLTC